MFGGIDAEAIAVAEGNQGLVTADHRLHRLGVVAVELLKIEKITDEGPRAVKALRRKMDLYQANGACLGWLLLPHERAVEIWRGGQQAMGERLENVSRLDGGELAEGLALELELELGEIWAV